jgi:hypothetical protein
MRLEGVDVHPILLQVNLCPVSGNDQSIESKVQFVGTNAENCRFFTGLPADEIASSQRIPLSSHYLPLGVHYVPFLLVPQSMEGTIELELLNNDHPDAPLFTLQQPIHSEHDSRSSTDDAYLLIKNTHTPGSSFKIFNPHKPGQDAESCAEPVHGCTFHTKTNLNKLILKQAHFLLAKQDSSIEDESTTMHPTSHTAHASNLQLLIKDVRVSVFSPVLPSGMSPKSTLALAGDTENPVFLALDTSISQNVDGIAKSNQELHEIPIIDRSASLSEENVNYADEDDLSEKAAAAVRAAKDRVAKEHIQKLQQSQQQMESSKATPSDKSLLSDKTTKLMSESAHTLLLEQMNDIYPIFVGFQQYTLSKNQAIGVGHLLCGLILTIASIAVLVIKSCWYNGKSSKFQ